MLGKELQGAGAPCIQQHCICQAEPPPDTLLPAPPLQMLDKELEHLDLRLRQPELVADRHEVAFVRVIAEALMQYEFEGGSSGSEVGGGGVVGLDVLLAQPLPPKSDCPPVHDMPAAQPGHCLMMTHLLPCLLPAGRGVGPL
jgi:hypothetical protein